MRLRQVNGNCAAANVERRETVRRQVVACVPVLLWLAAAATTRAEDVVRVACVGDSITEGTQLADPATQSWPAQLGVLLGDGFEVGNFGRSRAALLRKSDFPYWTTEQFTQATEFLPDIVVMMLGTNDSKPENWVYSDEFAQDYKDMMAHFGDLASSPTVWVCRPAPVFGDNVFAIEPLIVNYDIVPRVTLIASETGAPLIDLYAVLIDRPERVPDNVHPDEEGSALIAEAVYDALTAPPPGADAKGAGGCTAGHSGVGAWAAFALGLAVLAARRPRAARANAAAVTEHVFLRAARGVRPVSVHGGFSSESEARPTGRPV